MVTTDLAPALEFLKIMGDKLTSVEGGLPIIPYVISLHLGKCPGVNCLTTNKFQLSLTHDNVSSFRCHILAKRPVSTKDLLSGLTQTLCF